MARCDFSERTYETAYNGELARGWGGARSIFSPSQILEEFLGFDVAAAPGKTHKIWRILKARRPKGITLQPAFWPDMSTPKPKGILRAPVSIMFQFKIPEVLAGHRSSRQFDLWQGEPYYRFEITPSQHKTLRELETRLVDEAIVRYASPQFHSEEDYLSLQLKGKVMKRSQHVAPSAFDREPIGHHNVWTYALDGPRAYPNPDGEKFSMESFDAIVQAAEKIGETQVEGPQVGPSDTPRTNTEEQDLDPAVAEHIRRVAEACLAVHNELIEPLNYWRMELENLDLGPEETDLIVNYAAVQSTMAETEARWFLLR